MNKNNVNEVILNDKDICKKAYDLVGVNINSPKKGKKIPHLWV